MRRSSFDVTPFAAPIDIRFVGSLAGRCSFPQRPVGAAGPTVHSCRALSVSPVTILLESAASGEPGEAVTARFERIGVVRGSITRLTDVGFQFDVAADPATRSHLAASINWLKMKHLGRVSDKRVDPRSKPRNPKACCYFAGEVCDCVIIDMSRSGAAIAAAIHPPLGAEVTLGQVAGHVARHFNGGFGIHFLAPQELGTLEDQLTSRRAV